jgi:lipopolysaccharide export system permease protein
MKIFDRYIIKQFLQTVIFGLVAFIAIFVVVDMMENLDDFIDKKAGIDIVLRYYMYFMPEIIKLVLPVAMLLSSLFTTGRLSNQNELTAMKAGGISLYRFMIPLLIVALFVSFAAIFFNGWGVPFANKKKFNLERIYLQKHLESFNRYNIFLQESPTRIVAIGFIDIENARAHNVSIQDFSDTNTTVVVGRIDALLMVWDRASNSWTLQNGVKRVFKNGGETAEHFDLLPIGRFHFTPDDIAKKQERPDEMAYPDLTNFIEHQRRSGNDVSRWMVDLYGKISFPFASFIVVLFGVPFSSAKRRTGLAAEFGISIGLCFIYLLFMKTSQVFGYNGSLDPFVTAWLPNFIFLAAGILNLIRARK